MRAIRLWAVACAVSLLPLGAAVAQPVPAAKPAPDAKPESSTFSPYSGQPGKDVVWVPTAQALVDRMLDMAGATTADYVIDLGSGDGRTVITAAKRGIRALGVEYNPDMVALSKANAEKEGVGEKARFVQGDIFKTDFSDATVLTLFLLPELNKRLRPTILDMKPGTRVVSNTFDMGDWTPDQTISAGTDCTSFCTAFKWIVPAKAAGTWTVGNGELKLEQTYQKVSGTLTQGGKEVPVENGSLNGTAITFTAGGTRYSGTVEGGKLEAKAENGAGALSGTRRGS
ncbi:class I SAM-dependent methyltransferase [Enterovirga rhinocerotis]|uniref:Methyltransferase family protein n=1 Tax=Enterovirga rhinocerotis TaxID=1339210 RepID=A0A4R7BTC9_9HYPH|nr:class I SAM-dependent methyltransferase [Enterovirga rhinocerotis]TDR89004.1 methyltransferase family protein [Enterovirga rhinocerotis]